MEHVEYDPLDFWLELSRPLTADELAGLSDEIDRVAALEGRAEEDHVSSWGSAQPVVDPPGGVPMVVWTYDARVASGDTVRRLVDETIAYVESAGLPAVRLRIGQFEDL